jgi:hypothetical protein
MSWYGRIEGGVSEGGDGRGGLGARRASIGSGIEIETISGGFE